MQYPLCHAEVSSCTPDCLSLLSVCVCVLFVLASLFLHALCVRGTALASTDTQTVLHKQNRCTRGHTRIQVYLYVCVCMYVCALRIYIYVCVHATHTDMSVSV